MAEGDLVEVARADDLVEARLIEGLLESEGIHVLIPGAATRDTLDGLANMWSGGVPIQVHPDHAERARAILEAFANAAPEEPPDDEEGAEEGAAQDD